MEHNDGSEGFMTLIWVLVSVLFALLELAYPALVVIFFSFGAFGAAVASAGGASIKVTLLLFIVLSLLSLAGLRRHLRAVFSGRAAQARTEGPHPMVGQRGEVTHAIRLGATGEVSLGGSFWRAVADEPIQEGTVVRVLGTAAESDLVLRVEPER